MSKKQSHDDVKDTALALGCEPLDDDEELKELESVFQEMANAIDTPAGKEIVRRRRMGEIDSRQCLSEIIDLSLTLPDEEQR